MASVLTLLTKRVRSKFLPAASNLGERRRKGKRRKKSQRVAVVDYLMFQYNIQH